MPTTRKHAPYTLADMAHESTSRPRQLPNRCAALRESNTESVTSDRHCRATLKVNTTKTQASGNPLLGSRPKTEAVLAPLSLIHAWFRAAYIRSKPRSTHANGLPGHPCFLGSLQVQHDCQTCTWPRRAHFPVS